MTPSKLNELVAVEVMGWRVFDTPNEGERWKTINPKGDYLFRECGSLWHPSGLTIFDPSHNIFCSWDVVAKMRAGGWLFYIGDAIGAPTSAEFWKESEVGFLIASGQSHHDERVTDQVAICLAALRAVGVEESELNSKDND